jgi:hypothetical protein
MSPLGGVDTHEREPIVTPPSDNNYISQGLCVSGDVAESRQKRQLLGA